MLYYSKAEFDMGQFVYLNADTVQSDYRYYQDNKHFIQLANIIHENETIVEMVNLINENKIRKHYDYQFGDNNCSAKEFDWILKDLPTSTRPVHKQEITEKTLRASIATYFAIVFCLDYDRDIFSFYYKLFTGKPVETVVKTLVRILYKSKEKRWTQQYRVARALFDQIAIITNLEYKDIALRTSQASQLKLFPQLEDHQLEKNWSDGKVVFKLKIF